jgi:NDP-sugar pyrophosphorylase family protein
MSVDACDIDVLILAGGKGRRLRPVVSDRPKPLAVVGDRPFLGHQLEVLTLFGFRSVTICIGYMAAHFEQGLPDYGIPLRFSLEPSPSGTAGALLHAAASAPGDGLSDPFLVMNGDSIAEADLSAFLHWFGDRTFDAAMAAVQVDDSHRFGKLICDCEDRVTAFVEKDGTAGPGWVNAGVYLLRRTALDIIPSGRMVSLEREVFIELAGRGVDGGLGAWHHCSRMIDIGTPESYVGAHRIVGQIRDRVAQFARAVTSRQSL